MENTHTYESLCLSGGIQKVGSDKPGAVSWTSKYGAVYAVGYDGGVTEGMNEKGLVVNGLFCKGTVYNNSETEKRPPMSLAMFVAWLLDMNATTDEAVAVLKKHDFSIGGATFDGGTVSALHWGITDASGKSAIIEFDHGEIRTYDMEDFQAMTNDPNWPAMTAILNMMCEIVGANAAVGTADPFLGVSITRSILVNASVPYTYQIQGEPNVSSTQWRSFADLKYRRYYFDIVTNMGYYFIDLTKCDLRPGASVMKLDTSKETLLVGEANAVLKKSDPFKPMY